MKAPEETGKTGNTETPHRDDIAYLCFRARGSLLSLLSLELFERRLSRRQLLAAVEDPRPSLSESAEPPPSVRRRRLRQSRPPLMLPESPKGLSPPDLPARPRLVLPPAAMSGAGLAAGAAIACRLARAYCSAAAWWSPVLSATRAEATFFSAARASIPRLFITASWRWWEARRPANAAPVSSS